MRCPDCNKFVSLEPQEPETNLGVDSDGKISGDVRCALACAECSQELKETTFEVDHDVDLPEVPEPDEGEEKHEHELEYEETGADATESGGSRYQKNMRGFSVSYRVSCSGCDFAEEGQIEDSLQASAWDELV